MLNFGGTFRGDGLQGLDVAIMVSQENADKVIADIKKKIDNMTYLPRSFSIEYDNTDIMPIDQKRIEKVIKEYYIAKFDK